MTSKNSNKVRKTVLVTEEQEKWIQNKDELNFSGFIRNKLDEKIQEERIREVTGGRQ